MVYVPMWLLQLYITCPSVFYAEVLGSSLCHIWQLYYIFFLIFLFFFIVFFTYFVTQYFLFFFYCGYFFIFFSEVIQFLNIADETIKTGLAFYQCLLFSLYISWFFWVSFCIFLCILNTQPRFCIPECPPCDLEPVEVPHGGHSRLLVLELTETIP